MVDVFAYIANIPLFVEILQERANGPPKRRSGYPVRRTDSSLEKNTADSKTRKQTQDRQRQQSPRVMHPLE